MRISKGPKNASSGYSHSLGGEHGPHPLSKYMVDNLVYSSGILEMGNPIEVPREGLKGEMGNPMAKSGATESGFS